MALPKKSNPRKKTDLPKANHLRSVRRLPAGKPARPQDPPLVVPPAEPKKDYATLLQFIKRDFPRRPYAPPPADLKPMLASATEAPFTDAAWQFEIKWDGYRALAYRHGNQVALKSRNNLSFEARYPPVFQALQNWPVNAVVDGEIIVRNESGYADFNGLQQWHKTRQGELVYYVFDLLWLDGINLMNEPLTRRREILKKILPDAGPIQFSDSIDEAGIDFFSIARANGLEGIIAKQKNAPYHPGLRTRNWLKIKADQRQEIVICGYTRKKDTERSFSSLVAGSVRNGVLQFAGQVGTGFTKKDGAALLLQMAPLANGQCPFAQVPPLTDPVVWLKPWLVGEVKFTELTPDGLMRHPSFQGLREDKTISDFNSEAPLPSTRKKQPKRVPDGPEFPLRLPATGASTQVTVGAQHLQLTNLQKVYWPQEKITKRDLLAYYHDMAPYLLPYMQDRPQSLNRFPNGISGENFYQKDMAGRVDPWLKTFTRFSDSTGTDKDFLVCNGAASLLYMANLGCIEMNPWHSRVQNPHFPDWCVIDLDPGHIAFEKVIETALVVKGLLDGLGIPSFPKTSGSTGIHIYIPLGARYNYEQSKQFAELLVHLVHHELPLTTSLERSPQKRKTLIYLDYLQNRPIQTICAPYSVRPKPGATVSAPLRWEEVRKGLKMEQFNLRNMRQRVKSEGDLFTGVLGPGIDLNGVLQVLSTLI